jgi:hypothetical protein
MNGDVLLSVLPLLPAWSCQNYMMMTDIDALAQCGWLKFITGTALDQYTHTHVPYEMDHPAPR